MLAGISDDLYFQVLYGSGEVRYGPEGVDLSEFSSITKKVPRARERTWISISNWLFKAFGLNRDTTLCWVPSTDTTLVVRALPRG